MSELRWNPLLGTWTIVAPHRQNRPHLPKDYCPFCPGSGKVPDEFDVLVYDNDFPAFQLLPPNVKSEPSDFFLKKHPYGKCEVILYSSQHDIQFYELSEEHFVKLIDLWEERFAVLSRDEKIKYIFPLLLT